MSGWQCIERKSPRIRDNSVVMNSVSTKLEPAISHMLIAHLNNFSPTVLADQKFAVAFSVEIKRN